MLRSEIKVDILAHNRKTVMSLGTTSELMLSRCLAVVYVLVFQMNATLATKVKQKLNTPHVKRSINHTNAQYVSSTPIAISCGERGRTHPAQAMGPRASCPAAATGASGYSDANPPAHQCPRSRLEIYNC